MPVPQGSDPTYPCTQAPQNGPVGGLRRPVEGRLLAGVAAAIASWLGIDVSAVRIAFVMATVLGGAAVPLYAAGWLLIPAEGAQRSIAADLARTLGHR
jgi:phage shock protein C